MLRAAAALTLTGALALAGCTSMSEQTSGQTASPAAAPATASPDPTSSATPPAPPVAAGTAPASVSIPAIGLDEPLIDLGIASDGSMEVPADYAEVGWFTGGGQPGGRGPTVIAGHVDTPTGAAVFIRLRELQPGDEIHVSDVDGVIHDYVVTEAADYPKSAFPTARVFGATVADELRLITCGGVFDRAAASYVDNRVVYAVRADS